MHAAGRLYSKDNSYLIIHCTFSRTEVFLFSGDLAHVDGWEPNNPHRLDQFSWI